MLLAAVWRRLPTALLLGLAGSVLAAAAVVQTWLATPVPLDNARMSDAGLPGAALRLALAEGHFPVLPWLALAFAGFVAGRWLAADRVRPIVWLAVVAALVGAGGHVAVRVGVATAPVVARAFAVHVFYPASVTVVTLLGAVSLLLIAAVTAIERRRGIRQNQPLVAVGRASLTLLIVHVPLFRELTQVVGVFTALSATATLVVVVLVLLASTALCLRWQRHGYRYGAEWLLRRVASDPPAAVSATGDARAAAVRTRPPA